MGGLCPSGQVDDTIVQKVDNNKAKKQADIIHFFMLGIEGAGKTTIIRQLKCLCLQKPHNYQMYDDYWNPVERTRIFDEHELEGLKNVVRINIMTGVSELIKKSRERDPNLLIESIACQEILERCRQLYQSEVDLYDSSNQISHHFGDYVIEVVSNDTILRTLDAHGIKIEDGTRYFIKDHNKISNIFDDNYKLTNDDIVHARKPTVSFKSYKFKIKQLRVEIHDMGGQRSELVKIPQFMRQFLSTNGHCFLLYVSSLAGFQEPDKDAKGRTVLDKSSAIFRNVLALDGVDECTVMIFFNKQDRFEEICQDMVTNDDGRRFIEKQLGITPKPNKSGKPDNYDYLKDSIRNRFKEILKTHNDKKSYYMKYTQATDAKLMSTIFYAVENEIISDFFTQARYL